MRTIPARGGAGPTPGGIDVSGDDQLLIPPSFDAVHADARGRRQLPRAEFAQRYELCEDMAQMLVEHSQAVHHDQGVDPEQVLRRTEAGLASDGSGFAAAEAAWIVTRLAELLGWPWHALVVAEPAPAPRWYRPRVPRGSGGNGGDDDGGAPR